ncbi:hypothetical protein Cfor_05570, partial [Coptotermes formosanus]
LEIGNLQVYFHVPPALSFVGGRGYINEHLPQRWIGRTTAANQALLRCPPRCPDITPCYLFLWAYVKDSVFLPLLPQDLPELRRRMISAISEIDRDLLQRVWAEMDYRLDVCRVTTSGRGALV